jgi:hexokinase
LLNDTVSTLLAGKAANYGASFGSYIGYILGTGTNTCYIESNKEISNTEGLDPDSTQIINIESGNFGKAPVTDIDLAFDNTTTNPGNYTFEKMIAGGYFGGFCLMALKTAAMENVFSEATSAKILELDNLTTETVNLYIQGKDHDNPLKEIFVESDDQTKSKLIIEALIERSAKLIAANLAAVILKTGKGKSKEQPILITVEGSTFYKLEKLNRLVLQFLESYFVDEKQRCFKFDNVEQSSLIGAGLAALIDYSR